jgi:hypothetical protein
MIAADPYQGGATWAVLQYLLGFKLLGWNVCFIEPVSRPKIRPVGASLAESENARYFKGVVNAFGLADSASLLMVESGETVGLPMDRLRQVAANAQLLVNISGMLTESDLLGAAPIRVYLDLDPAFVQIWNAQGIDMRFKGHTHFVTVGQCVGTPGCPVPIDGLNWLHTLPPVVLDHWPVAGAPASLGLTTVGNWRAYGSLHYQDRFFGQKVHSLRPIMELPVKLGEPVTLAMAIDPSERKDLDALTSNGWKLVDPRIAAGTPHDYQSFIAASKAEIGITKHGYIESRCGWFSDRSACYLAAGRPVVAQETGWSSILPTGEGLFSFENMDDASMAVAELNRDPIRHSKAARRIAVDYLDSDKVLSRLLTIVGAVP